MRLYAIVGKGAENTDKSLENMGYIAYCPKCLNRQVFRGVTPRIPIKCPECEERWDLSGDVYKRQNFFFNSSISFSRDLNWRSMSGNLAKRTLERK